MTTQKDEIVSIDSSKAALLNRETILEKVQSITSRFNDSKEEEQKIQYLDDEKNLVNLSSDISCVRELLHCAAQVENAVFKHITQLSSTTCSTAKSTVVTWKKTILPSNPKEKKTGSFSCRSLDFPPLLHRLEEERKVVENVNVFQVDKNTRPPNTGQSGPTCSNCPYVTCDTSFHCGAINRHPEEKAQLKEHQKQHQDIKNELSSLRNEIAVKEAATKSIQQRYVYQVRPQLRVILSVI